MGLGGISAPRAGAWKSTETPAEQPGFLHRTFPGSMEPENKLPLLRSAFRSSFASFGRVEDRVAIVVYAGASGLRAPTPHPTRTRCGFIAAIERLEGRGLDRGRARTSRSRSDVAQRALHEEAATTASSSPPMAISTSASPAKANSVALIEEKRETGVFLTVLGFGMGNHKDATMEKLAEQGQRKLRLHRLRCPRRGRCSSSSDGTLVTIAKDVKIQVEFNPAHVGAID